MKKSFITLNAGLTLFLFPALLYCMEQEKNAKKLMDKFFDIQPVYHKGQPEYESFSRADDIDAQLLALNRDKIAIAVAQKEASTVRKSRSNIPDQTTDRNKTETETK